MINNAGTAVLSGASGVLYGANGGTINNTGIFQILRNGLVTQDAGNNAIFNNNGKLSLLPTASVVMLGWSYNQSAVASLDLKIGGTNAGTPQFDQFQCTHPVTLGGKLNISFIGGFVPAVGDSFAVMTYGSESGSFSSVSTPGALMSRNYNPGNLALTAVSEPTNFNDWKSLYFGDTSSSVDLAVPYGDGVPNLLKYALSMDPTKASVAGLPVAQNAGGHLTLSFSRRSPSDVTYTVSASDGLGSWTPIAQLAAGAESWTGTGAVAEAGTGGIRSVIVTDPDATAAHAKRFLHLQVTLP